MLEGFRLLAQSDRQDLYSMSYVRAIIAVSGFNFSKSELDRNSDDLNIELPNSSNEEIPAYSRLILQVKCTYSHEIENGEIHYPLPRKNYDDLRRGLEPKLLVVVLVPAPDIPWIECVNRHTVFKYRAYWRSLWGEPETENLNTITITVPENNTFDITSVPFLMDRMVINGVKNP